MTDYAKAYRAAFDFHKRWSPCPANLEEWESAAREIATVAKQGNDTPFLLDILGAVYAELERQYNERKSQKCE